VTATALEAARELVAPGDTDTVIFAWADMSSELYGKAHLHRSSGPDGTPRGAAMAVLFAGHSPAGMLVRGEEPLPDAGWDRLAVSGLSTGVDDPLKRWTVTGGGGATFNLSFEAVGPPAQMSAGVPLARAGRMAGYAQICRARGSMLVAGRERPVNGLGQRSHTWGNKDWESLELSRSLGIWFADGTGVLAGAVRPADAASHAEEVIGASLVGPGGSVVVHEPRLSVTSDRHGRPRRLGLELWLDEDEAPHRASGETLCTTTLDVGALRMDCAFVRWHMEGREGVGRYEVLRRA
jgi:hypothetical protein